MGPSSAGGNYQFNHYEWNSHCCVANHLQHFMIDATTNSGSINIPGVQNNSSGTHATGNMGTDSQDTGNECNN